MGGYNWTVGAPKIKRIVSRKLFIVMISHFKNLRSISCHVSAIGVMIAKPPTKRGLRPRDWKGPPAQNPGHVEPAFCGAVGKQLGP